MSIQYATFCEICTLENILSQQIFEWLERADSYQFLQQDGFGLRQQWLIGQNIKQIMLNRMDEYKDKSNCTPLHQALQKKGSINFIEYILQFVTDLMKVPCNGSLPLHTALANSLTVL
jgi:hypothetical protein